MHSAAEASTSTLYPKIGELKDALRKVRKLDIDSLDLIGTVKLHGTHADIVVDVANDTIRFQSGNRTDFRPTQDNNGFAAFVTPLRQEILILKDSFAFDILLLIQIHLFRLSIL